MSELFIKAARRKYKFDSSRGQIGVEELFDAPLTSRSHFSLDAIAREANRKLKEQTEESFVEVKRNPLKDELEDKLEIVKTVIAIRQAENEAALLRADRDQQRRKILDAIDTAENRELSTATKDDLLKKLAALDG